MRGMNLALMSAVCLAAAKDTGAAAPAAPEQSPVQFGSDEWGKWAKGVSDRQAETDARMNDVEKRLTALEDANVASAATKPAKVSGDVGERIKAIERQLGM